MLPTMTSRSAATARACVPYWLESTGWLAALMSDATAAAMGRLPSAGRPDAPRSMPSCSVSGHKEGLAPCIGPKIAARGTPAMPPAGCMQKVMA